MLGDDLLTLHSQFGPVQMGSSGLGPLLNLEPDLGSGSALNCGIPIEDAVVSPRPGPTTCGPPLASTSQWALSMTDRGRTRRT